MNERDKASVFTEHTFYLGIEVEKTLMLGKIEGRRKRDEDEMVGWHQRLHGHEFKQAPENDEGQGGLACCSL